MPVELAPGVAGSGGRAVVYRPSLGFQEMDDFVEIKTKIALDQLKFEIVRGARGIAFPNVFIKIAHRSRPSAWRLWLRIGNGPAGKTGEAISFFYQFFTKALCR